MSSRILGLDIRHHAVTGVVVRSAFKSERVETHFEVPLPGKDEFEKELSASLNQITTKIDTKDLFCHVALPAEWGIYRNVDIPIKGNSKIRQVLPYEIEPLLAQPIEELSFDFLPFTLNTENNAGHILAVGMARHRLDVCLEVLIKANLDPDFLTVGSFTLAGGLLKFFDLPPKCTMIALNGNVSSVYLILDNQIVMARTFKLTPNQTSSTTFINVNLNQTISAFEEQYHTAFDLQSVYIADPMTGKLDDIVPALTENCGCPVNFVNLFEATGLPLSSTQNKSPSGPSNNALALVLTRSIGKKVIDFRRGGYGKRQFFSEQRTPLIKTGILLGVLLFLGLVAFILDGYYTRNTLTRLDDQISGVFRDTFPNVRRIVDPLPQMKAKIREEKSRIEQMGVTERKVAVIDIINDISRLIKKEVDVTLAGLTIGPENMTLAGHAANFEMVNDMRAALEKATWVTTAIISSANRDKSGQRVDFKVKLVFESKLQPQKT